MQRSSDTLTSRLHASNDSKLPELQFTLHIDALKLNHIHAPNDSELQNFTTFKSAAELHITPLVNALKFNHMKK